MRQYQSGKPPLLLLQAILLAGSKVCTSPELLDADGSAIPAALTFYKRTKALFDADYETDRVTIIQALVLMGWYSESAGDVVKDAFYWTRIATAIAQSSGMHRSAQRTQLSMTDKRLWKRIWWTLFTRDRLLAIALGRPVLINIDECDVEMLGVDDFIEGEDASNDVLLDPLHAQFFLQQVSLCTIMSHLLSKQYLIASEALPHWCKNCPKEVSWEISPHFWSALLYSTYNTILCLLYLARPQPQVAAFHAAAMITSITGELSAHNELLYCPAFMVQSLVSALAMQRFQMQSNMLSKTQEIERQMRSCLAAVRDISGVWPGAKVSYMLLQERLGLGDEREIQSIDQLPCQNSHEESAKGTSDEGAFEFSHTISQSEQLLKEGLTTVKTQPLQPSPNAGPHSTPNMVTPPIQIPGQATQILPPTHGFLDTCDLPQLRDTEYQGLQSLWQFELSQIVQDFGSIDAPSGTTMPLPSDIENCFITPDPQDRDMSDLNSDTCKTDLWENRVIRPFPLGDIWLQHVEPVVIDSLYS
jgi:hypothetical protein